MGTCSLMISSARYGSSEFEQLCMRSIVRQFVEKIPSDKLDRFDANMVLMSESETQQLRIGTLCSGTEMPIFSLRDVVGVGAERNMLPEDGMFGHNFSVEIVSAKQGWLKAVSCPASALFADIRKMGGTYGMCLKVGRLRKIQQSSVLVVGWSCVDSSPYNVKAATHLQFPTFVVVVVERLALRGLTGCLGRHSEVSRLVHRGPSHSAQFHVVCVLPSGSRHQT